SATRNRNLDAGRHGGFIDLTDPTRRRLGRQGFCGGETRRSGGSGRFGECIVRSYNRASQCFLFARLTRTKQDFICRTLGSAVKWEGTMKTRRKVVLSIIAGAGLGAVVDLDSGYVVAQPMEKKGTTPYVTHFIFRPLMSIDIPGLGTATNLEAVGTT